jgi:tRNA(Ile)-lysidine synthase
MEPIQTRPQYTLVRPLLAYSKKELLGYLQSHNHPYFVDESNHDIQHTRNRFRQNFSHPLIEEFKEGITRSLDYLHKDKKVLESLYETIHRQKQLRILRLHHPAARVAACDQALKELGYVMSAASRNTIEKHTSMVIGRQWAVEIRDDRIYIAPYRTDPVPRASREIYRLAGIPPKIRPYCYVEGIDHSPISEKL